ncbi:MAG TPA: ATP-dependent DNA ligase, partial [Chthoniobacterales bacterium]
MYVPFAMIDVQFQRGVWLPEHDFWLDPQDGKDFAFISHAHFDHIAPHREVLFTPGTARLMGERLPGDRIEHPLPFGETTRLRGYDVTLLPAGHIYGSAQIHLASEKGTLLYTGDFKLRPGRSAEPAEWRCADILIMETTFGLPRYVFPPADEVLEQIRKFCYEALEEDCVPVLLGYSLGKAQEILASLADAGFSVMLHGAVYRMTQLYGETQVTFPEFHRYQADAVSGKVLICPPNVSRSLMLRKIKNRRVAMLTGWAMDPGATYRYQCDAVFPLSDHADYADLLRYVDLVNPQRILTLHGFAAEFARDLRQRGRDAWALSAENQLELPIMVAVPEALAPLETGEAPVAASEAGMETEGSRFPEESQSSFAQFAVVGETIASVTGKKEKIRLLAEFLSRLDEIEAPLAAVFLTGRPFAQSDPRTLQTGWAVIRRALLLVSGLDETTFRARTSGLGDIGKAVLVTLSNRTHASAFSLRDAADFFDRLHLARGPDAKTVVLREGLERVSPLEAAYLLRILTGDLRIGLKEGLVEESLATVFEIPAADVREANMLTGDIGQVTRLTRAGRLSDADIRLFHPVKVMLATPEPTAEAIWERIAALGGASGIYEHGSHPFLIEDKYDGIRAQVHASPERTEIFSRDLRRVTEQFPEIAAAGRSLDRTAILDGEILAWSHGKKLSFFDLQRRLGRKDHPDLFVDSDVPVVFTAFDLLYLDGQSLLRTPLDERRARLRALPMPSAFRLAEATLVSSAEGVDAVFEAARQRGNEGLMVKDPASLYLPGRRGLAWFKLKKELATLDVVVVGAELGHGKRSHVLSDYTFAIRHEETGELLTIGKAYSGLTDAEIEELTAHFEATTLKHHGHYRSVIPQIVLEVAFDSVQPSTRHSSGLALRFPRIKALRRDKSVADIDTLAYARGL